VRDVYLAEVRGVELGDWDDGLAALESFGVDYVDVVVSEAVAFP